MRPQQSTGIIELVKQAEKTITVTRNDFIKACGTVDTTLYYIESGSVKAYVHINGEEQIIRLGYAGNILVSLDSFLTEKPSALGIQAIKKTVLRVLSKQELQHYLQQSETNQRLWAATLEQLVLQQMEREIDLLTDSPKERYQRVLARSPQLFQAVPNHYIANYLRMSAETLSRLKKS